MSAGDETPAIPPATPATPPTVPTSLPAEAPPATESGATPDDERHPSVQENQPAPATGDEPPRQAAAEVPGPKMVRRVVVSYRLGWLPGDWLQTWRRLDRVFARAALNVKATLAPLEDLPIDTDILVVPPELREAAKEAALPGTPILVTPASAAAGAFADLVSRLKAGTEFMAEEIDPSDRDKPKIVSYRGHTLLD